MNLQEAVLRRVHEAGSLRAAERKYRVAASYLSRILHGTKQNPSDIVLSKLKITKIVSYEVIE